MCTDRRMPPWWCHSRQSSESRMRENLTYGLMRGRWKPVHGFASEAPGHRKIRATDRRLLPTRRHCSTLQMQNLQQKVPSQAWPEFKALVADMRDAPSVVEAERRRQEIVKRYQLDFPEACSCLLDDAKASLNHLSAPPRHQQYVRTSNLAERAFEEER